jgi:hypothetical protein
MTQQEAILYLKNVLETWSAFCEAHHTFEEALRVLLDEQEGVKNDTV